MERISFSLKARLIFTFSMVILVCTILYVVIGIRMIANTIINQAQDKVRLDLNSAREVYRGEIYNIKNTVRLTAVIFSLEDAILKKQKSRITEELQQIRQMESLDVLDLTDREGNVVIRTRNPGVYGGPLAREVVDWVVAKKRLAAAAQIVPGEELAKEGKDLAEQAVIKLIETPLAYPRAAAVETSGMVIGAGAPVFDYRKQLIGVLYGEKLINRSYKIVDKVKDIVYKGKKYKGRDIGTATIFQNDLRISTNVRTKDHSRAIGTRVSREVYDQVIGKGIPWIDRAFVVSDWYITAYEPITDLSGDIIGMLYVGILEAPYVELRRRVISNFLLIAFASLILLIALAYFTAARMIKPLWELMAATQKVAQGNLSHRVRVASRDEIGQLAESFNQMTGDLEEVTLRYQALNQTLESRVKEKNRQLEAAQDQLIQSEKLSSLGKMAAGVAHEINNPLTSILINAHLLREEMEKKDRLRDNVTTIIEQTSRCSTIVKDLLHFSRAETLTRKELTSVNRVIEKALMLLKSQVALQNVEITKNLAGDLPGIIIDAGKIEQVFTNIILNALDAMPQGGRLAVQSKRSVDDCFLEIIFRDNGFGIPDDYKGRVFDPFFTTKGTLGTGLGLSVSYGIVRQHGGKIELQSKEGEGTTIRIFLPVPQDVAIAKEEINDL